MSPSPPGEWQLLIETSGRIARVGLAHNEKLIHESALDSTRRHARDLTPTIEQFLKAQSLRVADLSRIVVSIGPGGYTGLRVGLAIAKSLSFASHVPLVAVPTFQILAAQAPEEATNLWVIADALKGQIYLQRFQSRIPFDDLRIASVDDWLSWANDETWITGPGVAIYSHKLPCNARLVPEEFREAQLTGLLTAAKDLSPITQNQMFALEPIYLRSSSAEIQAKQ